MSNHNASNVGDDDGVDYYNKYFKYKQKYLQLAGAVGDTEPTIVNSHAYLKILIPPEVTQLNEIDTVIDICDKDDGICIPLLPVWIEIPKTVKALGKFCFNKFSYPRKAPLAITFAGDSTINSFHQYQFNGLKNFTSIEIPASIETIPMCCFLSCDALKNITFKDNQIKTFKDRAFQRTGLISFKIPSSVTTVGSNCFIECANLKEIIFERNIKELGANLFTRSPLINKISFAYDHDQVSKLFDLSGILETLTTNGCLIDEQLPYKDHHSKYIIIKFIDLIDSNDNVCTLSKTTTPPFYKITKQDKFVTDRLNGDVQQIINEYNDPCYKISNPHVRIKENIANFLNNVSKFFKQINTYETELNPVFKRAFDNEQ